MTATTTNEYLDRLIEDALKEIVTEADAECALIAARPNDPDFGRWSYELVIRRALDQYAELFPISVIRKERS